MFECGRTEASQDILLAASNFSNFLNGQQSEAVANHPVKGRPYERVTYNASEKKKRTFLYISQGKSANSFTLSVKDAEGNLFDINDMRIEFVLEIL